MMDELNENFFHHIHQLNVEMFDNYQDFLLPISIESKQIDVINTMDILVTKKKLIGAVRSPKKIRR
jgi:DNA polymerase III delta prime subunit